jgi:hypothetical protein
MAGNDKTIAQLDAADTLTSADLVPVWQGGATKKATAGTQIVIAGDSRLTDSREWTGETVGQAEAEAGAATTRRAWTAERVGQAIVALALTTANAVRTALAADSGASKVHGTDAAGDAVDYTVDNISVATTAEILAGTPARVLTASNKRAIREWTAFAPVANVVRITWDAVLNRTVSTAAGLTLTFDAVDGDWSGDRLTGGLEITNSHGSSITVTLTNGDGDPDAPIILAGGGTTFDVTAGDTAIVHFETMANGTVYVVHRDTL